MADSLKSQCLNCSKLFSKAMLSMCCICLGGTPIESLQLLIARSRCFPGLVTVIASQLAKHRQQDPWLKQQMAPCGSNVSNGTSEALICDLFQASGLCRECIASPISMLV